MPELPEVETTRRTLEPFLLGRTITSICVRNGALRDAVDPQALRHDLILKQFVKIRRCAKYLLCEVAGEPHNPAQAILMIHLGMTGTLGVVQQNAPLRKHDHVLWTLDDGLQLRFHDPRRFGVVSSFASTKEQTHRYLKHLGVEPLEGALQHPHSIAELYTKAKASKRAIKQWLMDANIIVGVGNIYASEALFHAKISPKRRSNNISKERFQRLLLSVVETLDNAVSAGGTTLRDYRNVRGDAGYFQITLSVYARAGQKCKNCGTLIRKIIQGGRSTFYCVNCQR